MSGPDKLSVSGMSVIKVAEAAECCGSELRLWNQTAWIQVLPLPPTL